MKQPRLALIGLVVLLLGSAVWPASGTESSWVETVNAFMAMINATMQVDNHNLAHFTALPGSVGKGGIGISITENQDTNPVGHKGYVRVGRGYAIVTRNQQNTGDHQLLSSNCNKVDDTTLGDADYPTSLLGYTVLVTGNASLAMQPNIIFGSWTADFPKLVRSGKNLQLMLADGSGWAGLELGSLNFAGGMTTEQRLAIPQPQEGLVVYDWTLRTLCFYNGDSWQKCLTAKAD